MLIPGCASWRRVRRRRSFSRPAALTGSGGRSGFGSASTSNTFARRPGQGALAIECRAGDLETHKAIAFLDHADTCFAVTAERVALNALGGGCQIPIGMYCRREGESFRINGVVASLERNGHVTASTTGTDAVELGREIAAVLLKNGADAILFAGEQES